MNATGERRYLRVDGGEGLVGAVPHLLGFHPERSLVAIALEPGAVPGRSTIDVVMRADLPRDADDTEPMLEGTLAALARAQARRVAVVVVSPGDDDGTGPPLAGFARDLVQRYADRGVEVVHALWTPHTRGGQPWRCYDDPDCAGVAPDPGASELAAEMVAHGAMVAQLTPPDPQALLRRARLLTQPRDGEPDQQAEYAMVLRAVDAAGRGELPRADSEFVDLARALQLPWVRDAAIGTVAEEERAAGAQRLWLELVRGTPPPHRAAPAALLAVSVFCLGDGTLAAVAADNALTAQPGMPLATLVRESLGAGLTPPAIREIALDAAAMAVLEGPPAPAQPTGADE